MARRCSCGATHISRPEGSPNAYFAYYEDVALGWALWLLGHQVWLSPNAIVYHRHHGTSVRSPHAARQRNCERNACFTLLTHASDALLPICWRESPAGGRASDDEHRTRRDHRPIRIAFSDDHRLPVSARLDPRLYVGTAARRAPPARRPGASTGTFGSLSRVGLSGVLGAFGSLYRLARWGGTSAPTVTDFVEAPADGMATLPRWPNGASAPAKWNRAAGRCKRTRSVDDDESHRRGSPRTGWT